MSNEKTPEFITESPFRRIYQILKSSDIEFNIYRSINPDNGDVTYVLQITKRINNKKERSEWLSKIRNKIYKEEDQLKQAVAELFQKENSSAVKIKIVVNASYIYKAQIYFQNELELSW